MDGGMMRRFAFWRAALCAALALTTGACGARDASPSGDVGAASPEAAAERFMRAVAEDDVRTMALVFGTEAGPLIHRVDPTNAARRMRRLEGVLRHDGYTILGNEPIADRPDARMVTIDLRRAGRTYRVPFTTVRERSGRWLVEIVDLHDILGVDPDQSR
jgi:hypothetical protein